MKAWYAIYSSPRSEKKAFAELQKNGIEAYLPLQKTLKQWSDRKKWVEEPLFRSYLFVHIPKEKYYDVLNTIHVVRYIAFEGKAVPIPEQQIEAIRQFISSEETIPENISSYRPGATVEVISGPMRGLFGDLLELSGKHKVKVEISGLGQALYLTIPMSLLKVVKK